MKKHSLVAALAVGAVALSSTTQAGKGVIDAASIKVTVYKFAVAHGADCASPALVFASDAGVESDLLSNPTFGSGHVDPGTYECILIELSKIIHTSAATTSGTCTAGLEFPDVICHDGQGSALIDGTAVTCAGGQDNPQHVTLFVTTASAGLGGDRALLPPTSSTD
ncbi:MAG: hypothetical protein JOZ69_06060, partial [Myxococcales bacterium]|nr:hypothetical protein [Myxococcales bacterium]